MKTISESENYLIMSEYESVFLKIKKTSQMVCIGDFYGDVETALISKDEKYCVMCGAGVIIFYLNEPFDEYEYDTSSKQWKNWGRNCSNGTIWVKDIVQLDSEHIEIFIEDGQKIILDVYKQGEKTHEFVQKKT